MQCTVLTLSSAGSSHGEVRPRYALRYTAASRRQRTRGAPPPAGRFQKARCACRVALGPHGGVDGTRRVAASGPTEPTAPSAAGHPGTTSDCHEAPGLQLLLAFRQVACTPTWILPALRRRRFNLVLLRSRSQHVVWKCTDELPGSSRNADVYIASVKLATPTPAPRKYNQD